MSRNCVGAIALGALAMSGCAHAQRFQHEGNVVYLDQGWSDSARRTFYHTTQGTRLIPLAWFLAIEQPQSADRFAAGDYVARYRFIPDPDPKNNPGNLPVGFAKDIDPATHETYLGFTCGTCHTAQISYRGTTLRIDGGPARIDVVAFTDAVFGALDATVKAPDKFTRFAAAVLGERRNEASQQALREQAKGLLGAVRAQSFPGQSQASTGGVGHPQDTVSGFGRLDALGRAGNLLFGPLDPANLRPTNAPVDYPHLWDTPKYDWVQWNGSIMQPMARNVAEALGVGTHTGFTGTGISSIRSSIRVDNLHLIESQLETLQSPRWPEHIFGSIDAARGARGRQLYAKYCASCHEPELTAPNEHGKRFLKAWMSPLEAIGTDPTHAVSFNERTGLTGALGLGKIEAVRALKLATSAIINNKYDELGLSPEQRVAWDGYRPNEWRAPLAYKARALNGIWVTAPYLHNGSVPNLYELLLPAARRSKAFHTGSSEFDPIRVGFTPKPSKGSFELVTDLVGNSNAGHEFRNGMGAKGVVGPELTEQERWDLVEYMKTL